ncbi:MAG: TolC family protein, partial [Oricola sp.]|nr:TolC family protein [Oricola sp.]
LLRRRYRSPAGNGRRPPAVAAASACDRRRGEPLAPARRHSRRRAFARRRNGAHRRREGGLLPRITLVGGVSASAQTLSGVGADGSFGYGVGPSLSWSGFDIARVRAGVKAADARVDAAFAAYEQTVLTALEETQTALADYGRERVRLAALDEAAGTAREAAALARDRYDAGADDFIDVLDAESRLLAAEASLAESRTAATVKYISVYLALGAGWRAEKADLVAAL